jgi:hypothetical protein
MSSWRLDIPAVLRSLRDDVERIVRERPRTAERRLGLAYERRLADRAPADPRDVAGPGDP